MTLLLYLFEEKKQYNYSIVFIIIDTIFMRCTVTVFLMLYYGKFELSDRCTS